MSLHDPVANVAGRLQMELSTRILEKTRSALRGLQFQTPQGALGKGDNELKRASALLEYIAREEEGVSIPLTQLAKAVYAKEADFVKFHRQVGHFRQATTTTTTTTSTTSTNNLPDSSSGSGSGARRSSTRLNPLLTLSSTTSSIPSLTMKLGSYVNDSNGVATRARRLWNQLTRSSQRNPHQLQDMARFVKVYEAVCFFIEATRDARLDEEDEGKRLQPRTMVEMCNNDFTLTDFTDIMEHVQSMMDRMQQPGQGLSSSSSKTAAAAAKTSSGTISKESSGGKIKGSTKKRKLSSTTESGEEKMPSNGVEVILERANTMAILDDDPFGYILTEPSDRSFSPRFLQWKQQTLDQAIQSATLGWERDHPGEASSRTQLLEIAAQNVLESCGLLLIKN